MGMMEWYAKRMIERMTAQERNDFATMAIKEILASMTPDDKRDMMTRLVPDVMKTMLDGMAVEDRRKVVEAVLPTILFQLSSSGALTGITDLLRPKKKE